MRSLLVLIMFFLAGFVTTSFAQEVPTPVKVTLVSNIDTVKPGDSFKLGALMDIDPGWHIYWKYPGETGLPTKLKFTVPDGYQVAEVMWPVPSVYNKDNGGKDFGYDNSVLLWTDIEVPSNAQLDKSAKIETQISWISCKEICIPGKEKLVYDVTVSEQTKLTRKALFSKWHNYLPESIGDRENPFNFSVVTTELGDDITKVVLEVENKTHNEEIEYYPNPEDSLIIQNLKYIKSKEGEVTEISFDVQTQDGVLLSETVLDGLIVYSDSQKKRSAVEIKIDFNDT
ncbi:MAG: hypothetical protein DHS20C13_24440 [Thermodesulfobacteriota bacterium]|nr:MAG: hypothetical protein DHS20C13_24440 [Thermodesulfobacteriota bacterium]